MALITVLPLGLALAIVVPLARLLVVTVLLPADHFPWPDRLVVAGCGLRAAVPLALAEAQGAQLLALLFVVVLAELLLQPLLMRRLLPFSPETSPP